MIKEFHATKNDYFLDITAVLQNTSNKDYLEKGEVLLEEFAGVWESGYFKSHQREKVYEVSNLMLKKTMRAYPHYYEFVTCLVKFVRHQQDAESFELWLSEIDTLSKQRSSRALADFLEYTVNLFDHSILYGSRSREWYFRNGDFSFAYDTTLYLNFEKLDLICSTGRDSMVVIDTKGRFYPAAEYWIGEKGRITWRRAGFDEDKVYADLKDYAVDVQTLSFSSDSAIFYNKVYFDFPIPGVFTEKVLSSTPGDRASYPRFESYFKDYDVQGVFENVNFTGGIGMEGRKLLCSGETAKPATFVFKKGGDYFAVIKSMLFTIEGEDVSSSPASFSIYFDKDSIYHPGLQMKYNNANKLLSLIRLNRGIAQSPFFDAYHNIDMYCEALYWIMNSEKISFEMIRGISHESKAEFESDKFYSAFEYYKLQGIDETHPLIVLKKYGERYGSRTVKVGALADFMDKPKEQAVAMLLLLESKGFVVYDSDNQEALVKQRLYDYLLAHTGDIDYDVIHFNSSTREYSNAVVELASFDMLISGVPEISLSDSQGVYIYPMHEQIVMKKDKNFTFSGRIRAGLFEFYAHDCSFEYDTFMIQMPQIDSMSFFVKVPNPDTTDKESPDRYYRVQAMVEDMNGYMMIDKSFNKSGLKAYPEYPIFTSLDRSYVYYNNNNEHEGIYAQDQFYYDLDPFTLDSLDNFSTTGLRFEGSLSTGGVLPTLDDPLVVMNDYSLGLNSFTDEEGLPLYEGKAVFFDTIMMDNSGLHGAGRMEYLTSMTESSDFNFFPDSMLAVTKDFKVSKLLGMVEYAEVSVSEASQRWYPDSNLMVLDMIEEPFQMYDSASQFGGTLALSPGGLNGDGEFVFEKARIESDNFAFGHHTMGALSSDFRLFTDTSFNELAFYTDDFRTSLNFDQRSGKFMSTGVSSLVEIPFNKFICYMDEIDWEMDEQNMFLRNNITEEIPDINEMNMSQLIDLNLKGSEFISTRPDQDSLRFFSTKAKYDIQKNIIYAEDVKIIRVADAAIFPGDGKLNILKDAQVETLLNAEILADTASRFHHIYNANVNIYSSHNYVATGSIDYVDYLGDASPITLNSINVDSLGRTYAFGNIPAEDEFNLSPQYAYTGDVKISSWEAFLHFDGTFSVTQDCYNARKNYARLDTLINPMDIIIPVSDSLKSAEGEHIVASLVYSPGSEKFYPAFIRAKRSMDDISVISAKGSLKYDPADETFTVAHLSSDSVEDYLALHTNNCVLEGMGTVDLNMELPHVGLDLFGYASHYIIPDSTRLDLIMGFDFFFDPTVLRRFSRGLNEANLPGTETSDPKFTSYLERHMSENDAAKIIADLSNFGTIKRLPEGINSTFLLSQVKFNWNQRSSSFVSYGDIGVFSIGDEVVNRMVPGYVQIERKPSGFGEVTVYIEIPDGDWYFFSYRNYIMQVISSNEGFNTEILNLKAEKRIYNSSGEDIPYEFVISSKRKMIDFKRDMEEFNGIQQH